MIEQGLTVGTPIGGISSRVSETCTIIKEDFLTKGWKEIIHRQRTSNEKIYEGTFEALTECHCTVMQKRTK